MTRRVAGSSRIYRLTDPSVEAAYRTLVGVAEEHIAEVAALSEAFFGAADDTRPVTFDELDRMTQDGEVLLVDVRPASEFAAGHVEGAVNIPVAELAGRLSELPPSGSIAAYCRGPYCVMAATAVSRLRDAGLDAVRMSGGYPQWRDAGRPIQTSD